MTLDSRFPNPATAKASTAKSHVNEYSLQVKGKRKNFRLGVSAVFLGVGLLAAGCGTLPKEAADAQSQQGEVARQGPTPVDVAIARTGAVREEPEYTGTTVPEQEVSLRSQVEGQVLDLNVDVGDAVKQGQIIGQLDDDLLRTALNEAEAELAALRAEVARAENQVSNAKAQVEQARLELQQAQSDSERQQRLVREGAIAEQTAEQAQTTARTAAQAVRAAQEQVRTEQQAVAAAQDRVKAQQAVVAQAREQLSYARLTSPITGVVTQRVTEQGNLVQPNGEVLRIGDFSRVQVDVEVSELDLAKIRTGQSVTVRLDAFPNQTFKGQVTRISPAADQLARLVPVEVVIPNSNGKIGSGLLARVSFESKEQERVVVPQTAIVRSQESEVRSQESEVRSQESEVRSQKERTIEENQCSPTTGENPSPGSSCLLDPDSSSVVFVVTGGEGSKASVAAREVKLGERADGNVEILSGLKVGERFVARSGRPLKNGETVRLSIISETAQQGGQQ